MGNTLYLECYAGISGDMSVSALLNLGANEDVLFKVLKTMPLEGYRINIGKLENGLLDFEAILDHKKDEHHSVSQIMNILQQTEMTDRARDIAKRIFYVLERANETKEQEAYFNVLGNIETIVEIVAFSVCMDDLNITECIVPTIYEGRGMIQCQQGILPVPLPTVANIVKQNNLTLSITDVQGELITPVGAAIVAAIRTSDHLPNQFTIKKIGMGVEKRNINNSRVLRAMFIEAKEEKKDVIYKLETNIDDCTGEALGYVMEKLFDAGARDVHYIPTYMKKNRPAYELIVICDKEAVTRMEQIIFEETTTIGIRKQAMERTVLKRELQRIQTSLGEVQVKICEGQGFVRKYIEYASVVEICKKNGKSYQEVYKLLEREINEQ